MKKAPIEASLLLVDDDPSIIQVLSRILSDYTVVRFATSGADALRLSREERPDLILLDAQMGDMSGLQVCESLKTDASLADIPVIFVSSLQESELEVAVLEMGAVDFIRKPFNAAQVTARVNMQLKLKRLADDLRQLSRVDGLTGLPDERAFDETLRRELLRAAEAKQSLSLVLLDVDFFRSFEALYGRKAADACLVQLGDALRRTLARPGDYAARLDGDRFALVLPDTPAEAGTALANRVLHAIEALDIAHQGSSVSRHITCSAGLGSFDGGADAAPDAAAVGQALLAAAGSALSQARRAGHAQVGVAAPPAE
ncbi:diguanylate cyclase domain-containing protein [Variovorax sp. JS1663]|uniref:diguanylate cyclase domain-containing protein n=1 Tax=Variovorax sp. JS1663 TaxID=1851577 RepID=UPI000B747132|nr:diguanylate cyclase [Variovorax sp. JS1663]OUL98753.1 hypothetical protein A8M77_29870 [Variovorax sp. JS1663]